MSLYSLPLYLIYGRLQESEIVFLLSSTEPLMVNGEDISAGIPNMDFNHSVSFISAFSLNLFCFFEALEVLLSVNERRLFMISIILLPIVL